MRIVLFILFFLFSFTFLFEFHVFLFLKFFLLQTLFFNPFIYDVLSLFSRLISFSINLCDNNFSNFMKFSFFFLFSFNIKKIYFFDFFLSIFFCLGFFLKTSILLSYKDTQKIFYETGYFEWQNASFDQVLITASIAILGFIF